jgi:hypothetical protein
LHDSGLAGVIRQILAGLGILTERFIHVFR